VGQFGHRERSLNNRQVGFWVIELGKAKNLA
jgi:hypothetical protein